MHTRPSQIEHKTTSQEGYVEIYNYYCASLSEGCILQMSYFYAYYEAT